MPKHKNKKYFYKSLKKYINHHFRNWTFISFPNAFMLFFFWSCNKSLAKKNSQRGNKIHLQLQAILKKLSKGPELVTVEPVFFNFCTKNKKN